MICDPPSGSTFPIGTTTVVCTAMDSSGNTSQCRFTVTVVGLRSIKMDVLAEMTQTAQSDHDRLLELAISALTRSTTVAWWRSDLRLDPTFGGQVFDNEAQTAVWLQTLQRQRHNSIPTAVLQDWIERLIRVDRLLAVAEIEAAKQAMPTPKDILQALQSLALGDRAASTQQYPVAIIHYEQAWRDATRVTTQLRIGR